MLAFSKILKKYDKVSKRNATKSYMKMVDNSYLGGSDEVKCLLFGYVAWLCLSLNKKTGLSTIVTGY